MLTITKQEHTDAELLPEDEQIRTETIRLQDLKQAVSHALNVMYSKRDESMRDIGADSGLFYDNLEYQFSEILNSIEGRLQELNPYYSEQEVDWMSDTAPLKQQMRLARQEGINFVALFGLSTEEFHSAVKYIKENGLASMNYEATKKALNKYRAYALDAKIQARINARNNAR